MREHRRRLPAPCQRPFPHLPVPCLLALTASLSVAAEPDRAPDLDEGAGAPVAPGIRRALLICGHPGDDEHLALYTRTIEMLHRGLTEVHGFSPESVWIREGMPGSRPMGARSFPSRGPATREALADDVREIRKVLRPEDALWVIVLGHAHLDGEHASLNLPGPDLRDDEFGRLFDRLSCAEQVFFITTPASGFLIPYLSAPSRVVISATERDREVNETLFHIPLSEAIARPPEDPAFDADRDGRSTILDLYVHVARRVLVLYKQEGNLPTEHALLDDDGDGRGRELQLDYLEPELGGRSGPGARGGPHPGADGARAARILFHGGAPGTSSDPSEPPRAQEGETDGKTEASPGR